MLRDTKHVFGIKASISLSLQYNGENLNYCEKDCLSNYRHISLLSSIGNIMERCIFKYVHKFLLKSILITKFQSGFTSGDSIVNQLISISNDFGKAIDDGKEIIIIFCDISKGFDRAWYKDLLYYTN